MHVWVCALTCRCVHVPRTCAAVLGPFSRLALCVALATRVDQSGRVDVLLYFFPVCCCSCLACSMYSKAAYYLLDCWPGQQPSRQLAELRGGW